MNDLISRAEQQADGRRTSRRRKSINYAEEDEINAAFSELDAVTNGTTTPKKTRLRKKKEVKRDSSKGLQFSKVVDSKSEDAQLQEIILEQKIESLFED